MKRSGRLVLIANHPDIILLTIVLHYPLIFIQLRNSPNNHTRGYCSITYLFVSVIRDTE